MEANKEETIKLLENLIGTLNMSENIETTWNASAEITQESAFEDEDRIANVKTGYHSININISWHNPFSDKRKF